MMRRALRLIAFLTCGVAPNVLDAQCPDGSPPPCGSRRDTALRTQQRLNVRRVVVVPFTNLTGDPALDVVGQIASEWITNGLSQLDSIEVVSAAAAVAEAVDAPRAAGQTASALIARRTRAGTAVIGSYYRRGDSLTVSAQVVDVGTGRVINALDPVATPTSDPVKGLSVMRERVMTQLTVSDRVAPRLGRPPLYRAYKEFAEGLRLARDAEWRAAAPFFARAVALDSSFLGAHAYLASAHFNMSDDRRMDSALRVGMRFGAEASGGDRTLVRWMDARLRRDMESEYREFAAMAARDSSFDAVFLAGWAAVRANRPREAIHAFEFIADDERVRSAWAVYWNWYATALHMTGDYRGELDVASRGRHWHPRRVSVAANELRARAGLGAKVSAEPFLDSLSAVFPDSTTAIMTVARDAAREFEAHGRKEVAQSFRAWLVRAHSALARANANPVPALRALATVHYEAGNLDSAHAIAVRLELRDSTTDFIGLRALVAAARGDTAVANQWMERLDTHDRYGRSSALAWRARIQALLGNNREAIAALSEALRSGQPYGLVMHRTAEFRRLEAEPAFRILVEAKPPLPGRN